MFLCSTLRVCRTHAGQCLDAGSVPEVTYAFVEIAKLDTKQKDDIIGGLA